MSNSEQIAEHMCRACMCKHQNFHSIYDEADKTVKICEMLATTIPQLFIHSSDQMPKLICVPCLNKLHITYQFQQMCIASDKHMRNLLLGLVKNLSSNMGQQTETAQVTKLECNPVVTEDFLKLESGMKTEIDTDEVKELVLETFLEAHTAKSEKVLVESDEEWRLEDGLSSERSACDDSDYKREKSTSKIKRAKQPMRASNMHNETGVDEIEKPNKRNRRKSELPCPHCDKVFDRPYRLKRHSGVHLETRPFSCEICNYRFTTVYQLARHKVSHEDVKAVAQLPPSDGYKCPDCPRRFEKRESLAAHIQSHRKTDPGQVFKCDLCPKKFRKFTTLSQHARTHPENQKFKCTLCEKAFGVNAHLIEHMNKHNGLKPFVCDYCNKAFLQNSTLKEHQRVHTGEKPFLCSQCGKSFQNASNMRQHLLRHSGEKRYQCPECPSKFACQSDQIKHMSTHRAVKPHVCDICGSRFTRSYTLNKHKHIHTGERPHKCDECNMTFVFIEHMRRHKRTHTGEKPYKCKFCEKAYAESGDLNKHKRTHVGEKTYMCNECPEAFKYQIELREHQRLHYKKQKQEADGAKINIEKQKILKNYDDDITVTAAKSDHTDTVSEWSAGNDSDYQEKSKPPSYKCPECPSKFVCDNYRRRHLLTHRGTKPHACDICGKRFSRNDSLKYHKKSVHTGKRPHKCSECVMTFAILLHLNRHKRVHTGEKPYKFKYCEKAYADSGVLRKHLHLHVGEKTYMCEECTEKFKYYTEFREHQRFHYKQQQQGVVGESVETNILES